jgi:hypothetical protein
LRALLGSLNARGQLSPTHIARPDNGGVSEVA